MRFLALFIIFSIIIVLAFAFNHTGSSVEKRECLVHASLITSELNRMNALGTPLPLNSKGELIVSKLPEKLREYTCPCGGRYHWSGRELEARCSRHDFILSELKEGESLWKLKRIHRFVFSMIMIFAAAAAWNLVLIKRLYI